MGKCQQLLWRFTITSENKGNVTVKDIVSETKTVASSSSSSSNDVNQHFFRFDEFVETSEIFVESLELRRNSEDKTTTTGMQRPPNGEAGAVKDPGGQGGQEDCHLRYLCTNARVIEVILLQNVCDDSGKTSLVPTLSASVSPVRTTAVAAATASQSPSPSVTMALPVTARTTPSPPAALQSTVETVAEATRPFRASFRILNRHYQVDLGEVNSTAYNSLYTTIFPVLNASYSLSFGLAFRGVKRLSFGAGSVVVINWFDMSGNLTEDMKTNSTNGLVVGLRNVNLDVDPNSFTFEPDTEAKSRDDVTDKNQSLLIAIVASVFVILIVILVVIVVHLMKVKFGGRRSSQCEPDIVGEPGHQMAAHDAVPPSQLMWQTIPSLKDSFDGHDLEYGYAHEPPPCFSEAGPPCVASGGKLFPLRTSMTVSSCSSLSSSCSKRDCRENQEVFFSRVASASSPRSSYHETPVADAAAKPLPITLRPGTKRSSTISSSYFPHPPSRGILTPEEGGGGGGGGQHPNRFELSSVSLDYSQITQDYFAGDGGGGGTHAKNYFDAGRCGKAATVSIKTPRRLRSWSLKKNPSRRRSVVDFGNVFLPTASPFQLAPIESGGSAAAAGRVDPSPSSKRGCTVTVEPQESDHTAASSAAAACPSSSGIGEPPELGEIEDVEETACGGDEAVAATERKVTEISRAPSFTNSLTQLFTPIFAKSPKKPKPIQDNIHRSFTLPNDILFENTNLGTSNM